MLECMLTHVNMKNINVININEYKCIFAEIMSEHLVSVYISSKTKGQQVPVTRILCICVRYISSALLQGNDCL